MKPHERPQVAAGEPELLSVFLCFRYQDGRAHAERLFRLLHGRHLVLHRRMMRLDVYFSAKAPGAPDFRAIQRARLRTARAMVFLATEESVKERARPKDWVHDELRWWSRHRRVAPIVVQSRSFSDGELPEILRRRWPFANRLELPPDDGSPTPELPEQILEGIRISEEGYRLQELERLRRSNARLWATSVAAVAAAGVAFAYFRVSESERERAESRARLATANRLALESRATRGDLPNRAALLAAEGLALCSRHGDVPVPASHEALVDALRRTPGRALRGHFGQVACLELSPDGSRLASAGHDMTVRLWNLSEPGAEPILLTPHVGSIYCCRFSMNGRWLALGGSLGAALVDLADPGHPDGAFLAHGAPASLVNALAFAPDGRWLATAGSDGRVLRWSVEAPGSEPAVLTSFPENAVDVVFVDERRVVVAGTGAVRALGFTEQGTLTGERELWSAEPVRLALASRAGRLVAASSSEVRTWFVGEGALEPEESLQAASGAGISDLRVSPDGRWIAASTGDTSNLATSGGSFHGAMLWYVGAGADVGARTEPVTLQGHSDVVNALAFSADSNWLATGGADRLVRLFSLGDLPPSMEHAGTAVPVADLHGHDGRISALAFDGTGRRLASASADGLVRMAYVSDVAGEDDERIEFQLHVPSGGMAVAERAPVLATVSRDVRVFRLPEPRNAPRGRDGIRSEVLAQSAGPWSRPVAVSAGGRWLATTDEDSTVVWDLEPWLSGEGEPARHDLAQEGSSSGASALQFLSGDADRTLLALLEGSALGLVELAPEGPRRQPCSPGPSIPNVMACSGDGRFVALGTWNNEVALWSAERPDAPPIILKHDPAYREGESLPVLVAAVALDDRGQVLAAGSSGGLVSVWRLEPGRHPIPLDVEARHETLVTALRVSRDGSTLISADSMGSVAVWQVEDRRVSLLREWRDRDAPLGRADANDLNRVLALSPNGTHVASGGSDGRLNLWRLGHLQLDPVLVGKAAGAIRGIAFTSDGTRLCSLSAGGVSIHMVDPDELLRRAGSRIGRNMSWGEWDELFPGEPYQRTFEGLPAHRSKITHDFEAFRSAAEAQDADAARALQALVAECREHDDPYLWSSLCWYGALLGHAEAVVPLGEAAVAAAGEEPRGLFMEALGIAQARAGRWGAAAGNLRSYCAWSQARGMAPESRADQARWAESLEQGKDPFDSATIGEMLAQPRIELEFPFSAPEWW